MSKQVNVKLVVLPANATEVRTIVVDKFNLLFNLNHDTAKDPDNIYFGTAKIISVEYPTTEPINYGPGKKG